MRRAQVGPERVGLPPGGGTPAIRRNEVSAPGWRGALLVHPGSSRGATSRLPRRCWTCSTACCSSIGPSARTCSTLPASLSRGRPTSSIRAALASSQRSSPRSTRCRLTCSARGRTSSSGTAARSRCSATRRPPPDRSATCSGCSSFAWAFGRSGTRRRRLTSARLSRGARSALRGRALHPLVDAPPRGEPGLPRAKAAARGARQAGAESTRSSAASRSPWCSPRPQARSHPDLRLNQFVAGDGAMASGGTSASRPPPWSRACKDPSGTPRHLRGRTPRLHSRDCRPG